MGAKTEKNYRNRLKGIGLTGLVSANKLARRWKKKALKDDYFLSRPRSPRTGGVLQRRKERCLDYGQKRKEPKQVGLHGYHFLLPGVEELVEKKWHFERKRWVKEQDFAQGGD